MQKLKGYLLLGTAILACPCHLPIALALLAGTGLGAFLADNATLVGLGLAGYFVVALLSGLRLLEMAGPEAGPDVPACKSCEGPVHSATGGGAGRSERPIGPGRC